MTRKLVLGLLVVLSAVALGFFLSRKPWQVYLEQRAAAEANKRAMQEAEQERAELLRQKAHLDNPMGKEELAREAGFTKPGETPLGDR